MENRDSIRQPAHKCSDFTNIIMFYKLGPTSMILSTALLFLHLSNEIVPNDLMFL